MQYIGKFAKYIADWKKKKKKSTKPLNLFHDDYNLQDLILFLVQFHVVLLIWKLKIFLNMQRYIHLFIGLCMRFLESWVKHIVFFFFLPIRGILAPGQVLQTHSCIFAGFEKFSIFISETPSEIVQRNKIRPCKLKSDKKWKKFIGFVDYFSISNIFFNNYQISWKKIFFCHFKNPTFILYCFTNYNM